MGYADASGRIFITGRAKDLIIRGGHNIDPAAIEDCLMRHPEVADAGAVGMPDAYAGEVPVAYVTLRQGACVTVEELLAFAKATMSEPPAVPRRLFVAEQLPMTAVGKIYKPALRQDCARRHLLEVLAGEPIASLTVREEPGGGRVVCIELAAAEEGGSPAARQRIAADLKGYLLTLEWAHPKQAPPDLNQETTLPIVNMRTAGEAVVDSQLPSEATGVAQVGSRSSVWRSCR